VEYVVPAEPKFGSGRTVAVTVSTPIRSFGSRLNRESPIGKAVDGHSWRQARSALPTTRSSFQSRPLG
jgi:hypothetical protein